MRKTKIIFGLVLGLLLLSSLAFATTDDAAWAWSLDDADLTGSNPDDVSGNGLDGTNSGTTTGATGLLNEAFDWDGGASDYVSNTQASYAAQADGTLCMWTKFDDEAEGYNLFGTSSASFRVQYSAANDDVYFLVDGGTSMYSTANADWTQWHHLCFWWDGTNKKIYVDGAESVSAAETAATPSNGLLKIGQNGVNTNEDFKGSMDMIIFYDRDLTTAEISELYNGGAGFNPYAVLPGGNDTKLLEEVVEITQIAPISVGGASFATIASGSFELLNATNVTTDFTFNTLKNSGGTTGEIECRIDTDGDFGSSTKTRTVTRDQYGSKYIKTTPIDLAAGNYTIFLECRKSSGNGQIEISNGEGLISVLETADGTQLAFASDSFTGAINSTSYMLIDSFNFTTSDTNLSSPNIKKDIVINSFLQYNYVSTGVIDTYISINGTKEAEMPRYGSAGTSGSIGDFSYEEFSFNGSETFLIELYAKSSTGDGNVTGIITAKEFQLRENETKQINLNGSTLSSASYTTIQSKTIENADHSDGVIVVKASIPYEATTGAARTTFRLTLDSTNGTTITRDVAAANQEGVVIIQDDFIAGIGNYTVKLEGLTDSPISIVGGDLLSYVAIDLTATPNLFNVTAQDLWDDSNLTNFNVTTGDDRVFSDQGTGTVSIPYTTETLINLTVSKTNYFNRTYINADITTNLTTQIYQTVFNVNVTELLSENAVTSFTLETETGSYSTTNGTAVLFPQIGNYSWNVTSSGYFDLDQNAIEVLGSDSITIENISSTVINITAVEAFGGATINNFTITIDSLDFAYTRTQSTTTAFSELAAVDGSYNISINATGYGLANTVVVVDNQTVTAYEFELYTTESLNINIYDEVSRASLNGTNITVEIVGIDNAVYTTTNGSLYVDLLTPTNYELRYFSTNSDDYKLRSTFVSVLTQSAQDINLYLLNTTDTDITTAVITFQVYDETLAAVEDATVIVSRYYPADGSYVDVWSRKTTDQGTAVGTFETIDAFYRYRVVYDDEVKYQSSVSGVQFTGNDQIDIFIDLQVSIYDALQEIDGVSISDISWNVVSNTSAYYEVTYSASSSVTVCLTATAQGYLAESLSVDTVNISCETSTGGTLFVYVVGTTAGEITYKATASVKTSDVIGFVPVKTRTDSLGGLVTPTGTGWTYNMSWLAVLITMLSALIYIKNYPRTALLFQGITFLAITVSPIPFIPDLVSYAVVFMCLILFILMKKGGSD